MATETTKIPYVEGSAPATPAANRVVTYAKADGLMYSKDDAGVETLMSGGVVPGVLTQPTFVAAGTSASGTGDVTPGLPAGHTTNDILLLFVQSDMQAASAPAGYVKVGPAAGLGVAAAAGGTLLTVFWKRDGGSESDPTVTDTGDHTLAQIIAIRGCPTTGDPFINVGATRKATASTTGTASAGATPVDGCMVVNAFAHALDSASAVFSGWTNADLTSVTERIDVATADGNGGGIGVATGVKAVAGGFTGTTVTETSTTDVSLTFVMLPSAITSRAGFVDQQVFLTPGLADTWTKPTGAMSVLMQAIGGGGSGSAGRNAATAAGGGGGGGGMYNRMTLGAGALASTMTVTAAAGGAATANSDGAAGNNGGDSTVTSGGLQVMFANHGIGGIASSSGSGGNGGNGGGVGSATSAGTNSFAEQAPGGGTGGTTAQAGGTGIGFAGGSGAGGGTSQAASAGGGGLHGGGGGGGGRANTNVGTGGGAVGSPSAIAGGSSAGANGTDSTWPEFGGSGAAGGTSAAGPGGQGGWPGGGGGGGGSQSGAQRGGAGGSGVVVITTIC